jgi:hypothetical protein
MGKPMMIQEVDFAKIELLKEKLGLDTKVQVLRRALDLLEAEVSKNARIERWKKAVKAVKNSGVNQLKEFQTKGRFDKIP